MLYFNRIDTSEGSDINKTSTSNKKCDIYHYWKFLNYIFQFQPNDCNRCCDLLMMSMNPNNIAIFTIKSSDYCCIISLIGKNEAVILMPNG